jgi:hypothetical protein
LELYCLEETLDAEHRARWIEGKAPRKTELFEIRVSNNSIGSVQNEKVKIHRKPDRQDSWRTRARQIHCRHLSRTRYQSAYILWLEEQGRWYKGPSAQKNQRTGSSAGSVKEDSCGANIKHLCSQRSNRKKALRPDEKRELVCYANVAFQMSVHLACGIFRLSEAVYYYKAKWKSEDIFIEDKLRSLAEVHINRGFWMMFYHLRLNQASKSLK